MAPRRPWELYEAGAPKVTEEVIADGLEASKQWIKESIDLQLELVDAGRRRTARSADRVHADVDYGDDVFDAVEPTAATDARRGR